MEAGREFYASCLKQSRRLGSTFKSWYASPAVCSAAQRVEVAYGHVFHNPEAALAGAKEALALSSQCPDAYVLMARLTARSYGEALELFERGSKDYEKLLSKSGWESCRTAFGSHIAAAPPLHGVARCVVGAVNTLCRMRRAGEAYDRMQALLRLTPPPSESRGDAIWALAPEVVFRAKGPAACLSWLCEHVCDEVLGENGCAVWWVATWALAWAATQQHQGFKWSCLYPHEDESCLLSPPPGTPAAAAPGSRPFLACDPPRTASAKLRSGLALGAACVWLPHMMDMLLGDMPLPEGPLPPLALSVGSVGCQVAYVRYCGDLWRDTPGVLDFARRYRNTYEVFCIASDARTDRPPRVRDFRRFMASFPPAAPPPPASPSPSASAASATAAASAAPASASPSRALVPGIFPEAVMYEGAESWHGLVDRMCAFTGVTAERSDPAMGEEEVEILTSLLDAGCPVDAVSLRGVRPGPWHSPLSLAMYRGYGPEAVRALLRCGADPMAPDASGLVPLLSGASQGMWRELQAVFKVKKKLGSQRLSTATRIDLLEPFLADEVLGPAAPASTLFEAALVVAVTSPCVPCVAGVQRGCSRCVDEDGEGLCDSPHGPWCNFSKLLEVLVAYGMKAVPEPLMRWLWMYTQRQEGRSARQKLLTQLECLTKTNPMLAAFGAMFAEATAPAAGQGRKGNAAGGGGGEGGSGSGAAAVAQQQQGQKGGAGAGGGGTAATQGGKGKKTSEASGTGKGQVEGKGPAPPAKAAAPPSPPPPPPPPPPAPSQALQPAEPARGASLEHSAAAAQTREPRGGAQGDDLAGRGGAAAPAGPEAEADGEAGCEAALEPHQDTSHCWGCGKAKDKSAGVKLSKCSRCFTARYCCAECQHTHWPRHRHQCRRLRSEVPK